MLTTDEICQICPERYKKLVDECPFILVKTIYNQDETTRCIILNTTCKSWQNNKNTTIYRTIDITNKRILNEEISYLHTGALFFLTV